MKIYTNDEIEWKTRREKLNRVNGAETYGDEILKYQVPMWAELSDDITISTTNLLSRVEGLSTSKVNVQYIHTWPEENTLWQFKEVSENIDNVIFVTSYKELNNLALEAGYNSIFIPMTIDDLNIPKQVDEPLDKFIWYGNVTDPKWHVFARLMKALGKKMDYISGNRLNDKGPKLTQQECWDIIKQYKYGIGVGRAYMEMAAMGLKCIVAGADIGGLVMDDKDHEDQVDINYNARHYTYSKDLGKILDNIDSAYPKFESIHDNKDYINKEIKRAYEQAINA